MELVLAGVFGAPPTLDFEEDLSIYIHKIPETGTALGRTPFAKFVVHVTLRTAEE